MLTFCPHGLLNGDFRNPHFQIRVGSALLLRALTSIPCGSFRDDWLVDRSGKWREPDYSAPVYPSFACGAGNMLSADLVHWLAQNINVLKTYQVGKAYTQHLLKQKAFIFHT